MPPPGRALPFLLGGEGLPAFGLKAADRARTPAVPVPTRDRIAAEAQRVLADAGWRAALPGGTRNRRDFTDAARREATDRLTAEWNRQGRTTAPEPAPEAARSGLGRTASTKGSTPTPPHTPNPLDGESRARRARAFGLRSGHRGLIRGIHDSVACCGLGLLPSAAGGDGHARLNLSHELGRAEIAATTRCASPWSCPVCAPKIAYRRAENLRPQVAAFLKNEGTAWLVTLTVRHEKHDRLQDLFDALKGAWTRVTQGAAYTRKRERGAIEYVRGHDVTWSPANGWHPHLHLSLFLGPEHGDGEATAKWIVARWMDSLRRAGWNAEIQGQDAQRCRDASKAAAYACTPAACYEAVAMSLKRARGEGSGATPFEVLAHAVHGDAAPPLPFKLPQGQARHLWKDYVEATKGRRQVTTSRGVTLADDKELCDEDELPEQADELALIGPQALRELDRRRLIAPLLDAVEGATGDELAARQAARSILSTLAADDWRIPLHDHFAARPHAPDGVDRLVPW